MGTQIRYSNEMLHVWFPSSFFARVSESSNPNYSSDPSTTKWFNSDSGSLSARLQKLLEFDPVQGLGLGTVAVLLHVTVGSTDKFTGTLLSTESGLFTCGQFNCGSNRLICYSGILSGRASWKTTYRKTLFCGLPLAGGTWYQFEPSHV